VIEIKPRISGKVKLTEFLDFSSEAIKFLMTSGYEEGFKILDKKRFSLWSTKGLKQPRLYRTPPKSLLRFREKGDQKYFQNRA
jgi:hypothetical protein